MALDTPVWFIAGASSGFGKAIALEALGRGHKVIAGARNLGRMADLKELGAYVMELDVTSDEETLESKAKEANAAFNGITHLINSPGYVMEGTMEEVKYVISTNEIKARKMTNSFRLYSAQEAFDIFNCNVFGVMKVTRAVLPYVRKTECTFPKVVGNLGSMAGWTAWTSSGLYNTTKWAVNGLTECLAVDTAHLGIKVCSIEPGLFRTNVLTSEFGGRKVASEHIPDYAVIRDAMNASMDQTHGTQQGDVTKGARVIVDVLTQSGAAEGREIPPRLVMGTDAMAVIGQKCSDTLKLIEDWKEIGASSDY